MTRSHDILDVRANKASGPGALDGHEFECSCGLVGKTSLGASEALRQAGEHLAWADRVAG